MSCAAWRGCAGATGSNTSPRRARADFIYVPPWVPHQEINASVDAELSCVLVRSGQDNVVVNLDLPGVVDAPQWVRWIDDLHRG